MADLLTLADAKAHLRITHDAEDTEIDNKVAAATQIVIDYLTRRDADWNAEMEAWTVATVPRSVREAILVQLGDLYRNRGDDDPRESRPSQPGNMGLSPTVMSLLMRYRAPGVA